MKKGEREEKQGVGSFTGSKRRRDGWNNNIRRKLGFTTSVPQEHIGLGM